MQHKKRSCAIVVGGIDAIMSFLFFGLCVLSKFVEQYEVDAKDCAKTIPIYFE